ncbi:histone deacetylase 14, chloroplastic-like [Rutidosis leptorrhynchoides]|uniref:histone deacetylase 14, chloroplastic-like n=1 Tax=Rutidosis leptorrhynchoides TaxID=125765 RepID=UPI003A9A4BB0
MNNPCGLHYQSACSQLFLSLRTKCSRVTFSKAATITNDDEDIIMPKVIYSLAPALGHHKRFSNNDENTRIPYILNALEYAKLTPQFRGSEINQIIDIRKATMEDITSIHSTSYYSFLEKTVKDAKASKDGVLEIETSKFPTYVTRTTEP